MRDYRHYDVYRVSMDLVDHVYRATRPFPKAEQYGLTSQLRRSAVSIPSNISEGAGRESEAEFARFLHIARGSVNELRCQLEIAHRQGLLESPTWQALDKECDRVRALLHGLLRRLGGRQSGERSAERG